jgi:hypothetical protein
MAEKLFGKDAYSVWPAESQIDSTTSGDLIHPNDAPYQAEHSVIK